MPPSPPQRRQASRLPFCPPLLFKRVVFSFKAAQADSRKSPLAPELGNDVSCVQRHAAKTGRIAVRFLRPLLIGIALLCPALAMAEDFPSKTIRLIVPF